MQVIILAGGSGERFWPLSNAKTPKQFLRLFGNKSLIRHTYERLSGQVSPEDIYVVTSSQTKEQTKNEIPEIPEKNILGEPFRRNTAAACFTGTLMAKDSSPILVLPADHKIEEKDLFWDYVKKAAESLNNLGGLYTFGIKPTRPETGYGYIERGEKADNDVYHVKQFHEKPQLELAKEYLNNDCFYWNSGMFLWTRQSFMSEMKKNASDIYNALINMDPYNEESVKDCYEQTPTISIDYALMEKSDQVKTIPISINWSDVGSWESVKELEGKAKENENTCMVDSENVYVRSTSGKKIAVVGVNDLIVIEAPEGILICNDSSSQKVREAARKFNY
ncbi:MAG: sugar phosphate nucleotidyltransferase [Thermotogota bacterium]|nr:sugar phosphate nucleotidyltransferase [Thermotogota bacterium]